ncbi:MAG: formylglycine-generating enzyme family protein [Armatimonadota bacterium]
MTCRFICIGVILALCSGVFAAGTATSKGAVRINPKDGAEMVWVPAGWFIMGSTEIDIDAGLKAEPQLACAKSIFMPEVPKRKVYLDGYWIYKYEVTVAQYRKFCEATKRKMPEEPGWGWKDKHPIYDVTWNDAQAYAKWAGVSLPTEAQWEKAARGTDGRTYPWGNKWDASKCVNGVAKNAGSTKPVGSIPVGASPYGCMDMAGNVWEWCADWYDENYYKNAPVRNPTGPSKPVEFKAWGASVSGARVLRGGSWNDILRLHFRCANRHNFLPRSSRSEGFRCAKNQ